MQKKLGHKLWVGFLFLGLFSCSEDLDFGQFDDLDITPTLESSLVYMESPESQINNAASNFYSKTFQFEAFNESYFADRVIEGSITYELENTTSKDIELEIDFLDASGSVLDSEIFTLSATPSGTVHRETFYGAGGKSLDVIKNTTDFRVSALNLGDQTSQSGEEDPKIVMRSSGRFMVRVK